MYGIMQAKMTLWKLEKITIVTQKLISKETEET